MNKILKVVLVVIAIVVCIKLLLSIENLLQIIVDNAILISLIVAIISGLFVSLTRNDNDSEIRPLVILIFVISILTLVGQIFGFYAEKGIEKMFK